MPGRSSAAAKQEDEGGGELCSFDGGGSELGELASPRLLLPTISKLERMKKRGYN